MRRFISVFILLMLFSATLRAEIVDTWQFSDPQAQSRAVDLAKQLRCPQCQNQNLVESTSPIARDLRLEVYKMVDQGKSNEQIIAIMTERFGDFVLYKPRLTLQTLLLWFGPLFLLIIASVLILRNARQRDSDPVTLDPAQQQQLNNLLAGQRDKLK